MREAHNQPHMMPIYSLVDRAKDEFWIANGEIARIGYIEFQGYRPFMYRDASIPIITVRSAGADDSG